MKITPENTSQSESSKASIIIQLDGEEKPESYSEEPKRPIFQSPASAISDFGNFDKNVRIVPSNIRKPFSFDKRN